MAGAFDAQDHAAMQPRGGLDVISDYVRWWGYFGLALEIMRGPKGANTGGNAVIQSHRRRGRAMMAAP